MAKNIPNTKREDFPYAIDQEKLQDPSEFGLSTFENIKFEKEKRIFRISNHIDVNSNVLNLEKPKLIEHAAKVAPPPTTNPYLTMGTITITTGTEANSIITTAISTKTSIKANVPFDCFTYTEMYTETFSKSTNETYTLTHIRTNQLIPTIISFSEDKETDFLITTYTVDTVISVTHLITESRTSLLTSTKTTPKDGWTNSVSPYYNDNLGSLCVSETSFPTDIKTEIYTILSTTYTWTAIKKSATYTITNPLGFTITSVLRDQKVNVTGCKSPISTETIILSSTTTTQIDAYISKTFPAATPIPMDSTPNFEGEKITLTFKRIETETDVISTKLVNCKSKGIMATWTMAPTYTSIYVGNTYTMTNTKVLQSVITEVGNGEKCVEVSVTHKKTMTDAFATSIIKTLVYTERITKTDSIYYVVSSENLNSGDSTYLTQIVPGRSYITFTMTEMKTVVGMGENMTYVSTYGISSISTYTSEYVEAYLTTFTSMDSTRYSISEKNTKIETLVITLRESEKEKLLTITPSSFCTNYLGKGKSSISSTVIYTYTEFLTLVNIKNTESYEITLKELGKTIQTSIESVNALHTHISKQIETVTSSAGETVLNPNSTYASSLLRTFYYTATYIKDATEFSAFEDQCAFKQFTFSSTNSIFPIITNTKHDTIVTVQISLKELTQTLVPSLYSNYTYGYTILDSTATYIIGNFMSFTMTNTIIYPGMTEIIATKNSEFQTATGSNVKSMTIVDYIPARTPFTSPKIEELNPLYTRTNITVTTASAFSTTMLAIYQKNTTYSEETITNVYTSTTMFTETFVNKEGSLDIGHSTLMVLVPTQISVKSGLETTILTYHKTAAKYYTVTHTIEETVTVARKYSSSKYESPTKTNVSSYITIEKPICYHSTKVTEPTSAYIFTDIFYTWLWTSSQKSVLYTVSMLKDYTLTDVKPNDGKEVFIATYSCTSKTISYSNTLSEKEVSDYTTFVGVDFPPATTIPTQDKGNDFEPIATKMLTKTYTLKYNTYVTGLSSILCNTNENTVTLAYLDTFKQTFVQEKWSDYIQTYTQTQTVGYTIIQLKVNETNCNTHLFTKTVTGTQVFAIVDVPDARKNNMFKESVSFFEVPYNSPTASALTETYTNSIISLAAGSSSKVNTISYADISTFVGVGDAMTFVKTYTETVNETELKGPIFADVLKKTTTSQHTIYSAVKSSTKINSIVYTQKSPDEVSEQFALNPCISYGTQVIEVKLNTYMETYSEYAVLAGFLNTGKYTTVLDVGTFKETEVAAVMFFETITTLSLSTVVRLGSPVAVKPGDSISNYITTTFTLTQTYVNGVTTYTQFVDICNLYSIVEKETTIQVPVLTNTQAQVLVSTTTPIGAPTDIEYITYAPEKEYREGLTLYKLIAEKEVQMNRVAQEVKQIPTRTFSLFESYTTTSSFFEGDVARIYALGLVMTSTVVEVPSKTYTLVIDTPYTPPETMKNSNLIYIIVGVVLGVVVIVAITVIVILQKRNDGLDELIHQDIMVTTELTADLIESYNVNYVVSDSDCIDIY